MEEQRNMPDLLAQIPQCGFWVRDDKILQVNQAAEAMLLAPGDAFPPLICTGREEYAAFTGGQLSLTLTIGGQSHPATLTRMADGVLVLLDPDVDLEEFRSMALVAMELRQPLMQAIAGARQQNGSPAMHQSLMQMLRMVSNMADVGRFHSSSRMEVRDVDALLLELFEKARTLAEPQAVICFEGLRQPVYSSVDPEQLERAVWNILSNSLKFLPQGGSIAAKLTRHGRMLRLTVEDSGSGIAQNVRSQLFRRYLRQPGIEDSRYGLGLGLAMVRAAAANHGGTVLVSSAENGGTKIVLTLSIRQDGGSQLRSPLLRPDYTGGWDHALVELSDCLPPERYTEL